MAETINISDGPTGKEGEPNLVTGQKFVEFMMQADKDKDHIANRTLAGANFTQNGICEIN